MSYDKFEKYNPENMVTPNPFRGITDAFNKVTNGDSQNVTEKYGDGAVGSRVGKLYELASDLNVMAQTIEDQLSTVLSEDRGVAGIDVEAETPELSPLANDLENLHDRLIGVYNLLHAVRRRIDL